MCIRDRQQYVRTQTLQLESAGIAGKRVEQRSPERSVLRNNMLSNYFVKQNYLTHQNYLIQVILVKPAAVFDVDVTNY